MCIAVHDDRVGTYVHMIADLYAFVTPENDTANTYIVAYNELGIVVDANASLYISRQRIEGSATKETKVVAYTDFCITPDIGTHMTVYNKSFAISNSQQGEFHTVGNAIELIAYANPQCFQPSCYIIIFYHITCTDLISSKFS